MNLQENIPIQIRRRTRLIDNVLNNLLENMYPCDYSSEDHFVTGVLDEIRWFLIDINELKGIERKDIEDYIFDYKYDEITDYFNERCVVLKNDNIQESIKKILKEETNLPLLIRRRIPADVLENEFKDSLESAFDLVKRGRDKLFSKFSYKKLLEHFVYITISMLIDSIHYELYSTLPEDIQWYDDVYKILEKHYRKRIVDKFMNHFSI